MRNICSVALVASSLLFSAPVAAQDDIERLAPISDWTLDYAEDSCGLIRTFGDTGSPVVLEMRQYVPGGSFVATIARRMETRSRDDAQIAFAPQEDPPRNGRISRLELGDGYFAARFSLRSGTEFNRTQALYPEVEARDAHERSLDHLRIERVFQEDFVLETGNMQGVFSAARDCMAELLTHWGLDGEAHRSLSSPVESPRHSNGGVFARIPNSLRRNSPTQGVEVLVFVNVDGTVSGCRHSQPLYEGELAEAVCALMIERGEFVPAHDAAGNPMPSYTTDGFFSISVGG